MLPALKNVTSLDFSFILFVIVLQKQVSQGPLGSLQSAVLNKNTLYFFPKVSLKPDWLCHLSRGGGGKGGGTGWLWFFFFSWVFFFTNHSGRKTSEPFYLISHLLQVLSRWCTAIDHTPKHCLRHPAWRPCTAEVMLFHGQGTVKVFTATPISENFPFLCLMQGAENVNIRNNLMSTSE